MTRLESIASASKVKECQVVDEAGLPGSSAVAGTVSGMAGRICRLTDITKNTSVALCN